MNYSTQDMSSLPDSQVPLSQPVSDDQSTLPTTPETTKSSFPKMPLVMLVIFIFLVGGGVFGYFSLQQPKTPASVSAPSPSPTSVQPTQAPMAHYIGTQTIALRDVSGGTSSGKVTRTITETGGTHSVRATLPSVSENTFYELWLTKPGQQVPLGAFKQVDGDKYALDIDEYPLSPGSVPFEQLLNTVIVSFETINDDSMETKILEGTFTQ